MVIQNENVDSVVQTLLASSIVWNVHANLIHNYATHTIMHTEG